jgi:hypothetical protein
MQILYQVIKKLHDFVGIGGPRQKGLAQPLLESLILQLIQSEI